MGEWRHPPVILKFRTRLSGDLFTSIEPPVEGGRTRAGRYDFERGNKSGGQDPDSISTADFFDTGIRKLVPRYQKCVEVRGDYVEK